MIRTFLERRRVRRAFEKLVDPERVNSLLRDGVERQPLKHGRIEFVLAFVRGDSLAEIKIVHGAADGHYGLFGSETRMSYTFLVPQFDKILGALGRLDFGETEAYRQ